MCTSNISLRKFIKLYLWMVGYGVAIALCFAMSGYSELTLRSTLVFLPFRIVHSSNFGNAFMVWWLFIPFLNAIVNNITKRQHQLLIALSVMVFTVYAFFHNWLLYIDVNPVCWFSTIYFIASYIRKHPTSIYKSTSSSWWGMCSLMLMLLSMSSVVGLLYINSLTGKPIPPYLMLADSNHPFALIVAVSTFMYFKNLKIKYSRFINILGGASF